MEKRVLTDKQAWTDLASRLSGEVVPAVFACFALLFGIGLLVLSLVVTNYYLFIPAVVCCIVFVILRKIAVKKRAKFLRQPIDVAALIYDTDVCIRINRERGETDADSLVFGKSGSMVPGINGCPFLDNAYVGQKFFTVTRKDNPKIKMFYPMDEWCLESLPDEETDSTPNA